MSSPTPHTLKRAREARWNTALRLVTHLGAWLPLLLLAWDWWNWQLVDPIREATLRTGKPAITLLMLSLLITPLDILFGWKRLLPLRRTLGLYAFMYTLIHFSLFVGLDYQFNLTLIREALFEKRYALAGLAAFLLLIPLAATSNQWSMRQLKKRWKQLHRLAYVAGVLAVVHYVWLVKQDYFEPILYTLGLTLMLVVRLKPVRQRLIRWRQQRQRTRVIARQA